MGTLRRSLFATLALVVVVTAPTGSWAQAKPGLVLMPLRSKSVTGEPLLLLGEMVALALYESNSFKVVTPQDLEAELGRERMLEELDCDQVACAAEIGGALGARYVLSGSVRKLGDNVFVSLSLIDTQKRETKRGMGKGTYDPGTFETLVKAAVQDLLGTGPRAESPRAVAAGSGGRQPVERRVVHPDPGPREEVAALPPAKLFDAVKMNFVRARTAEEKTAACLEVGDAYRQYPLLPRLEEFIAVACADDGKSDSARLEALKNQARTEFLESRIRHPAPVPEFALGGGRARRSDPNVRNSGKISLVVFHAPGCSGCSVGVDAANRLRVPLARGKRVSDVLQLVGVATNVRHSHAGHAPSKSKARPTFPAWVDSSGLYKRFLEAHDLSVALPMIAVVGKTGHLEFVIEPEPYQDTQQQLAWAVAELLEDP